MTFLEITRLSRALMADLLCLKTWCELGACGMFIAVVIIVFGG